MGKLLYHPRPVSVARVQPHDPDYFASREPLSRDDLKAFLKTNLLRAGEPTLSTGVVRRPFAGELVPFVSPDDENIVFQLKRCGVRENLALQNMSSTVRYVQRDETGEFVTERDLPIGDQTFAVVSAGLGGWNLLDENNAPIPVNEDTIKTYLSPTEFSSVHEKIIEINPMWQRGGESKVKKS